MRCSPWDWPGPTDGRPADVPALLLHRRRSGSAALIVLLTVALAACLPHPQPSASHSVTPTPSSSPGREPPRYLITCYYPDGSEVSTFTRLDEAWASPNYVRIDYCDAAPAQPDGFELTEQEAAVAEVASAGIPDADPTDLFLQALAACVRTPADGEHAVSTYPHPILEAALVLCPDAPHAELMRQEVASSSE
jgi:hypothetical protein